MDRRTFLHRLLAAAGGLGLAGCASNLTGLGDDGVAVGNTAVAGGATAGNAPDARGKVASRARTAQARRPNIVFILADDLGWGDLGVYGQSKIRTPNLDRMAAEGMRFTQHYAGSTVCAPSRCCLMTGFHTGHGYVRGNRATQGYDLPLPETELTVAEMLRRVGYRTACVGKWGLGGPDTEGHPNQQGFDYFYGYLGQAKAHAYYPSFLWENERKIDLGGREYSHDLIAEKALGFINEQGSRKDQPFFLYLPVTIPHAELAVPEDETVAGYRAMGWPETPFPGKKTYRAQETPRAVFAAMIARMDRDIGRVLDALARAGLDENTLVVFSSDNGPHKEGGADPEFFRSAGPFRGTKRDLYEGGIRVPFIARWPGTIRAGATSDHLSAFWDWFPTCAALAGADATDQTPVKRDGISMLSELTGTGAQPRHDYLYWEFHEQGGKQAIRKGDWKAIRLNRKTETDPPVELYDLAADPGETKDIASSHPDVVKELKALFARARTKSPIEGFRFAGEGEGE